LSVPMDMWELVARERIRDTLALYNWSGDAFRLDEMMQAFCEVEIGTTWTLPILYTAILIILVIRPYGLKGSPSEARL